MDTNPDVARVTSEQRSKWDDSARSYNEVLIRKGAPEPNSRQVLAAVVEHTKENTGMRGRQHSPRLPFSQRGLAES